MRVAPSNRANVIVGTGIDILSIERMEKALGRWGDRLHRKVFTEEEVAYCRRKATASQSFAGRFAAKEATMKALGTGWRRGVRFRDIEVYRRGGPPAIRLHGEAARLAEAMGVDRIHLSLTHENGLSMAQVVFEKTLP